MTSEGISSPFSASTRCRVFSATSIALVPLRLEIAKVTAGLERAAGGEVDVLGWIFPAVHHRCHVPQGKIGSGRW